MKSVPQKPSPVWELEMIDHVDQQERLSGFIMYVVVRHGEAPQVVESFSRYLHGSVRFDDQDRLLPIHSPNTFC